jgi:methionine biosynthesis protein MetW
MNTAARAREQKRADFQVIEALVEDRAKVLDIGCGDGELLKLLAETRHVDGRGIEISQAGVNRCVASGLSVIQGDADRDLVDYPDDSFDFVILSQTIQAVHRPRTVLAQLLRIGKRAIVSLPNFCHWRIRLQLLARGRMPVTNRLPYTWYDTPNIHYCTIRDFVELCNEMAVHIDHKAVFDLRGRRLSDSAPLSWLNIFGEQAVFLLSR